MQRLHVDDFTAFLLHARPDTVHLKIPAVAPCDLEYEVGGGKRYIFREGELLEPDRLSHEFLQEMRALQGLSHYNSQYLQEPLVSGGRIIEPNWFRRFQAPRKHDYRVISIDPAFTQDGGDHSAAIICNFVGLDIEIIHAERVQLAFTGLVQWVRGLDQKWSPDAFVIEAIGTGRGFCDHLRHGLGMNMCILSKATDQMTKSSEWSLHRPRSRLGACGCLISANSFSPFSMKSSNFHSPPAMTGPTRYRSSCSILKKSGSGRADITRPSSHRLRPPSLRDAGGRVSTIAVRSGPGRCGTPALRHKVTERVRLIPRPTTNSIESRDLPTTKKLQFKSGTPLTDHLKAKSRRRENLGRLAASSSPARASRNDLLPPLDLAYIPLEDLRMPAREIRKLDPRARARGRQFDQHLLRRDAGIDGAAQVRLGIFGLHYAAATPLRRRPRSCETALPAAEATALLGKERRRPTCLLAVGPSDATSGLAVASLTGPRRACAARADVTARKPKKRWPFQAVPVIALTICERLA